MIKNATDVTIDYAAKNQAQNLASGSLKYSDLYHPDANGRVKIGTLEIDASAATEFLDSDVKTSKLMETYSRGNVRIEELQKTQSLRVERINASLAKAARSMLIKSPAAKAQVQLSELTDLVRHTELLNNPLGIPNHASLSRTEIGDVYLIRITGSVVGEIRPGESKLEACARLNALVPDDIDAILAMSGLQPTPKNREIFRRNVSDYNGALPEGHAAVLVMYGVMAESITKAMKIAANFNKAAENGQMHLVDPSRADTATLRLNMTEAQKIAEVEQDDDGDELSEDTLDNVI